MVVAGAAAPKEPNENAEEVGAPVAGAATAGGACAVAAAGAAVAAVAGATVLDGDATMCV